jgi:colanic acid/amylovoran biosynthesis protein
MSVVCGPKSARVLAAAAGASRRPLSVGLFGAAPDTGNLGVTALCLSAVQGVWTAAPGSCVTVFDHGRGVRAWERGDGGSSRLAGAYFTRRLYRQESFGAIDASLRLGGLGNRVARTLRSLDAVLDVSGGDSLTDLYGSWRLKSILAPKLLAIRRGIPLILLPQTYGPFRDQRAREAAARVVRRAVMAWARDEPSYGVLRDLLGDEFDPERHRCGVDLAFLLPMERPHATFLDQMPDWLRETLENRMGRRAPLIGINVSGLIWHDPERQRRYGFIADYRRVVLGLLRRLLEETDATIMLVPHVVASTGSYESDADACSQARATLVDECPAFAGRVAVAPELGDPRHAKWLISRCDWFCGTRMHATIAALSSSVPTSAVAYSPKTRGVFGTCGQGDQVGDPTRLDAGAMIEHLWGSWLGRDEARHRLARSLHLVRSAAHFQQERIVAACGRRPEGAVDPAA